MALNKFKCYYLMPLHFKGLKIKRSWFCERVTVILCSSRHVPHSCIVLCRAATCGATWRSCCRRSSWRANMYETMSLSWRNSSKLRSNSGNKPLQRPVQRLPQSVDFSALSCFTYCLEQDHSQTFRLNNKRLIFSEAQAIRFPGHQISWASDWVID